MNVTDIMNEIYKNGYEIQVFDILHKNILHSYDKTEYKLAESKACLRAIKKINAGKNEAINNLCE